VDHPAGAIAAISRRWSACRVGNRQLQAWRPNIVGGCDSTMLLGCRGGCVPMATAES